jgi:PST family polysaccharide transporter
LLSTIKNKLKEKDNKVLLSNFFSLSTLQIANFILPLLSIPYLIRVLGVELYGFLAFAMAFMMYFMILSDYGFNLTATREISVYRDSKEKIIEIFSSVMIIKFLLMLCGLLILSLVVFSFEKFSEDWLIYYLTFGMVIGQVLFPIWFFQGMEKMKYISILNIIAKLFFVGAIFIFVQEKEDYYLVPLFNSLGFIISGIIAQYYIKKEFGVSLKFQDKKRLMLYFKDGWHIFFSNIAVVAYTSTNILILGLLTNNVLVGYYAIAERVVGAVSTLGRVVNQVLFPHFSKVWTVNKKLYYSKFKKVLLSIVSMMLIIALIVSFLSSYIIWLLSSEYIEVSINVLSMLIFVVVLYPLGALFTQSFITQKKNYLVIRITLLTMLFNVVLIFPLIQLYGVYGVVITVLSVQIFHLILNGMQYLKLKKEEDLDKKDL